MKNDQIKSQIENAKKAFVAGKEREQEASLADVSKDEAKVQEHSAHEERQLQEAIMTRVQGLMEEASKSSGVQRSVPINPGHLSSESRANHSGHRIELIFLHLNNLESDKKCKSKIIPGKKSRWRSNP